MSKVQHNGIYYDPHNEIVCDKLRLKEIIEENEQLKKQLAELKEAKSKELAEHLHASIPKYIVNEKVELLEKLRKHYCHLMWDGRGTDECWVIQECVDILDKQIKQLKVE